MADKELRELERAASQGDLEAIEKLRLYRERLGWPRVLPAPAEPYEWSNKVSAWLNGGFDVRPSWFMTFGAYGSTLIVVRDSSLEDALATAASWLADNQPGHFVDPEYDFDEHGNCAVVENGVVCGRSPQNDVCEHVEAAEDDLTYTESGWLASYEWYASEIETTRAIVSELSRALLDRGDLVVEGELQVSLEDRPLIVYGLFWEAIAYKQPPGSGVIYLRFPNDWNEEQVRDVASGEDSSVRWFVEDPKVGIFICWVEPGDDPIGADAEDYAGAWDEADCFYSCKTDEDRWLAGARMILWEVTHYREPD